MEDSDLEIDSEIDLEIDIHSDSDVFDLAEINCSTNNCPISECLICKYQSDKEQIDSPPFKPTTSQFNDIEDNPILSKRVNYLFYEYELNQFSEEEKEDEIDKLILENESPSNNEEDDYIVDEDTYLEETDSDIDSIDMISPPPISNYFMNHPHYNTANDVYQKSLREYIHSYHTIEAMTKDRIQLRIPTQTIQIPIIEPENGHIDES